MSGRKLRPCLIISEQMDDDIMLCQVTSKFSTRDDFVVELKKGDSVGGSLMLDSYLRCNMIFTASMQQITRSVCSVSKEKYSEVVEKIISIVA